MISKKILIFVFTFMLILVGVITFMRLKSGEDRWICQNGQWQRHGNPSQVMPNGGCEK